MNFRQAQHSINYALERARLRIRNEFTRDASGIDVQWDGSSEYWRATVIKPMSFSYYNLRALAEIVDDLNNGEV